MKKILPTLIVTAATALLSLGAIAGDPLGAALTAAGTEAAKSAATAKATEAGKIPATYLPTLPATK